MSALFSSFRLRSQTFRNRIFVSPMCQYSSIDGFPTAWHLVHLGSRAVGGAALVMMEATAVSPEGRISPGDQGLWSDDHGEALKPIVHFIKSQGAAAGIQIAHAGRKASTDAPWRGGRPLSPAEGGWSVIAPSPVPFATGHPRPEACRDADLRRVVADFAQAARRAHEAGFDVLELHMAHGYLLHEFLSPLANRREDRYGGRLENRVRLPLEVTEAVRMVWPDAKPLFVRISASDWVDGGWDIEQSLVLARELKARGVDLIDCSSGGMVADAQIPAGPGYQTPFATRIRTEADIAVGAVGLINEPLQAEQIVRTSLADCVFLGRELLRDPYWPLHAAHALHSDGQWPAQYERARP
ncbi:MAG: NADH:flavin oxidoreductase/NADH oxidase [Gammaproteobacteria bacterium]|uniref:NADH:flavin oxidoreductase/NADH oxidase n=1 Tax=Acidiferrobacter sp. SPIII_3 TaxID=1281578 RepID=UPI000D736545|nr:NADH:flavin oxidoreductase/NADH oxidase [Acidiferrobacter sp. SPIII_3]AWP22641.1 oxidoreductase [Acidiferrobacter sp. SPIII_3]MDA8120450.1 NADH:flavin oxidoreductase/NADH oxidase [Gammaproteobacteria bacterium]